MTANNDKPDVGKDDSESIDSTRRTFLGAAAAAATLSTVASDRVRATPNDSTTYPETRKVVTAPGALQVEQYDDDTEIRIAIYPHQLEMPVNVELCHAHGYSNVGLEPDDARNLARELLRAADDTDEWRASNSEKWEGERL